jgi:hypothetical protein
MSNSCMTPSGVCASGGVPVLEFVAISRLLTWGWMINRIINKGRQDEVKPGRDT